MEIFKNMMYILVTSALVENIVLAKFLGCCPFLGVSKKLDSAVGMSSAVIFVLLMATAVTWPIYTYLLEPFELNICKPSSLFWLLQHWYRWSNLS